MGNHTLIGLKNFDIIYTLTYNKDTIRGELMKNIAIIADSSISFSQEDVLKYDVIIAPLMITHNNTTYIDGVDMDNIALNNLLRANEHVTTSQPNIGTIIETLEMCKAKNYDHIFILSIGTALSGAMGAFQHALNDVNLDNVTLVNTYSIAGPVQQMVQSIRHYQALGESIEFITEKINNIVDHQVSYLFPETLKQVIQSGRVSRASATVASLLRVNVALVLKNKDQAIEKLAVARTKRKIYQAIVDDFIENNVSPITHDIYLLESEGMERLLEFKDYLTEKLGDFKSNFVNLPAAVATHGGLGCIAIQWCPKI